MDCENVKKKDIYRNGKKFRVLRLIKNLKI